MNAQQVFEGVMAHADRFPVQDRISKFRTCGLAVPAGTNDPDVLDEADKLFSQRAWNFDRVRINGVENYVLFFL